MFLGRVVAPDDSLWLDEDRDKVRALLAYLAMCCTGCGIHQDDIAQPNGYPHYPPRVIPETHRCYVCEEAERLRKSIPRDQDDGVQIRLRHARFGEFDEGN